MPAWWAVALAAFASFVLGAVWFTPLFGRLWDLSTGYDRSASDGRFPVAYYVLPLVGSVVAAVAIAGVLALGALAGPLPGLAAGALIGVAAAAASVTNALTPHTPRPYLFGAVSGGYHLVGGCLMGVLIGWLG